MSGDDPERERGEQVPGQVPSQQGAGSGGRTPREPSGGRGVLLVLLAMGAVIVLLAVVAEIGSR